MRQCKSGEELCDDLTCSDVDCKTRDYLLADDEGDTIAPTITFRGDAAVRLTYGGAAAAAALLPCDSSSAASDTCYAIAIDDDMSDVSASLVVEQDVGCSGCSSTKCPLSSAHLCLPGKYGHLFSATDASANRAVLRLSVTVVEESSLTAIASISTGSSNIADVEAQAALIRNDSSAEAVAFRQGIAELLNTTAQSAGEDVRPADIVITAVSIQEASNSKMAEAGGDALADELSLLVEYSLTVSVAAAPEYRRHMRHLLANTSAALSTRVTEMTEITAAAATDGRMGDSLSKANADCNASLPTAVAGLDGDILTTPVSPMVDEIAAYTVSIEEEVETMGRVMDSMASSLEQTEDDLTVTLGAPEEFAAAILDQWISEYDLEMENIDTLAATIEEMLEKLSGVANGYTLVQESAADAQIALQDYRNQAEHVSSAAIE
eukprot:gene11031-13048_t